MVAVLDMEVVWHFSVYFLAGIVHHEACYLCCYLPLFPLRTGVIRPLGTQPLPEEIIFLATVSILATLATPSTTIASHMTTTPTSVQAPLMAVSTTHSAPVNAHGMILSSVFQPIPARLTRRILSGEFVEMRDLLRRTTWPYMTNWSRCRVHR